MTSLSVAVIEAELQTYSQCANFLSVVIIMEKNECVAEGCKTYFFDEMVTP